ncbi:putative transcriptional regulator, TetR family protein [Rhizocola hellebori]|uniref:Putative transcriptional regulator, TetR family protein n=1 Tax=Rhizocola hellebori TaxID=1392758 RepID=A0A8J3VGQ3_9ACTN|nr:TetR/AcrR family transcriptional regulator [Rhizocola hellebori]GIH06609.1 putative transcriptional regulator, TetR family protein [Rhizocola hellebori]
MPRVSDEHLANRRRQILDAARTCFLRNGFHATSMQDVIAEAGLSVGAVYRYFKSKNEIVTAIAEEVVGGVDEALADLVASDLSVTATLGRALSFVDAQTGPDGVFRLAIQVWAEAMRDPALAKFVSGAYGRIRGHFVELARHAQARGELSASADAEAMGAVLFGMMPAYALQRVLTGTPDRESFLRGVTAILKG